MPNHQAMSEEVKQRLREHKVRKRSLAVLRNVSGAGLCAAVDAATEGVCTATADDFASIPRWYYGRGDKPAEVRTDRRRLVWVELRHAVDWQLDLLRQFVPSRTARKASVERSPSGRIRRTVRQVVVFEAATVLAVLKFHRLPIRKYARGWTDRAVAPHGR